MALHVYTEIPTMQSIAPMNGPIYGGFAIDIEGKGFINTGTITLRFELLEAQHGGVKQAQEDDQSSPPIPSECIVVETTANFVSPERLLCSAPTFPQEGVYMVSVSLNGIEFSNINATTWFLVWQNWQRRKLLLSHDLFSHPMGKDGVGVKALQIPTSLAENDVHTLRRKSSFMLPPPTVSDTDRDVRACGVAKLPLIRKSNERSSGMRTVMRYYELAGEEVGEFADPKLLHWHPASATDEKYGSFSLSLLIVYHRCDLLTCYGDRTCVCCVGDVH